MEIAPLVISVHPKTIEDCRNRKRQMLIEFLVEDKHCDVYLTTEQAVQLVQEIQAALQENSRQG